MQVSGVDIQNAMLQLFRDRGLAAGDELSLARLEHFWAETRLRRSDLLDGLVRLAASGLIILDDHEGESYLALTEAGAQRGLSFSESGRLPWNQYLHDVLLPGVRRQARAVPQSLNGRRSYDLALDNGSNIRWPSH